MTEDRHDERSSHDATESRLVDDGIATRPVIDRPSEFCIPKGDDLRAMRVGLDLTLEEAGSLVGIAASHLSLWENEQSVPRLNSLRQLVGAYRAQWPHGDLVVCENETGYEIADDHSVYSPHKFLSPAPADLRAIRDRFSLSRAEAAAGAYLHPDQLQEWEQERTDPEITSVRKLLDFYKTHSRQIGQEIDKI
ncbi:helix-turn-helix domain-containing protein [Halococcus sp. AFM35]|uniref:helix-turn-helix domain-containing protein n=1 Tax=Halococcus sp. AFM35 TaxID=3421653 RepID=UPI003EBE699E